MEWKFSLPESQNLVYYFMKLIGLAPFTMKDNRFHPPTLLGKLYPVIVATGYLLSIPMMVTQLVSYTRGTQFTKIWRTITYLLSIPSSFLTPIIFLMMNQKIVYVINKLCIVSNGLKSLGVKEDDGKYLRNIFWTTVMANTALIAICVVMILIDPHWPIFVSINYCIINWLGLNTILIFVQTLFCIRRFFTLVNEKLYNLLTPDPRLGLPHHSQVSVVSVNDCEENHSESEGLTDFQRMRRIEALHLELYDLVDRTTDIFSAPILLNSLRLSTGLMMSSYWMYIAYRNSGGFEIVYTLCFVLRSAIAIVLLFIITHASATTCEQGNATKDVLSEVWIKFKPAELADEFVAFSRQLRQTTVAVSAFEFMNLDYTFIVKIFSTVITYLIIVIQFETS